MSEINWSQLFKYNNLLLFFIIITVNEQFLEVGLFNGQKKNLEDGNWEIVVTFFFSI